MTVSTIYPDANPETSSVDGYATETTNGTWATVRAAAGDSADASGALIDLNIYYDAGAYDVWSRAGFVFDAADELGDLDTISAAKVQYVATAVSDSWTDSVSLVTWAPASETNIVAGDYDSFDLSGTKQATDVLLSNITADSSTLNDLTLNATGRGNISKTVRTLFGIIFTSDADNSAPGAPSNGEESRVQIATADTGLGAEKRPRLEVTHTAPPTRGGAGMAAKLMAAGVI